MLCAGCHDCTEVMVCFIAYPLMWKATLCDIHVVPLHSANRVASWMSHVQTPGITRTEGLSVSIYPSNLGLGLEQTANHCSWGLALEQTANNRTCEHSNKPQTIVLVSTRTNRKPSQLGLALEQTANNRTCEHSNEPQTIAVGTSARANRKQSYLWALEQTANNRSWG